MEDSKDCNGLLIERLILEYPTKKDYDKLIAFQVQETEHVEVQRTIGFDTLPREIRDQIYALIFLKNEPLYPNKERAGISEYIALLRVNSMIYAEAVEILYGRNIFQIRGSPAWQSPELLNRISGQRYHHAIAALRNVHTNNCRQAEAPDLAVEVLPESGVSRVIYLGSVGIKDMEIVNIFRLLRDRRPLLKHFSLWKRTSYKEAQDITWMILEKPYRSWYSLAGAMGKNHVWRNQDGVEREAMVVSAPQTIPE